MKKYTLRVLSIIMVIYIIPAIYLQAQNVGIGIGSPLHRLHVLNSLPSINAIHSCNTGTTNGIGWSSGNRMKIKPLE